MESAIHLPLSFDKVAVVCHNMLRIVSEIARPSADTGDWLAGRSAIGCSRDFPPYMADTGYP